MLALCLAGCVPTESAPPPCGVVSIQSIVPVDGVSFVEPGSQLVLTTEPAADGAEVWVDGGVTDGWVPLTGAGPSYEVPTAGAVEAGHTYTVRLRRCGAVHDERRFDSLPGPQGLSILGRSYLLDLSASELQWTEPPTAPPRAMLESLLGTARGFLVAPLALDSGSLRLGLAVGDAASGRLRQDACVPPLILEDVDFSMDPRLLVTGERLTMDSGDPPAAIEDATLQGVFDLDGAVVHDLRLAGALDTRSFAGSAAQSCEILGALVDATCVLCASQGASEAPRCLLIDVTQDLVRADPTLAFAEVPQVGGHCW